MKTTWIIFTVCMIVCIHLKAQSPDCDQIIYDDLQGNITAHPDWCNEGGSITFTVTNVNPFAIKSTMTITVYTGKYDDGIDVFQQAMDAGKKAQEATENAKSSIAANEIIEQGNSDKFEALKKLQILQLDSINMELAKAMESAREVKNILMLDTITYLAMNDVNLHTKDEMLKRVNAMYLGPASDLNSINKIYENYIKEIQTSLSKINQKMNSLQGLQNNAKKNGGDEILKLKEKINKLNDTYSGINLDVMDKKMFSIRYKLNQINTQEFKLPGKRVVTLNGDYAEIGDTLKTTSGDIYKVIDPIKIRSYGGTRLDFSAGFASTFGPINGTDYFILRDTSDQVTGLDSSVAGRKYAFCPVTFMHVTFKTKSMINPALSVGLNPDFTNFTDSKLLLGGTIAFNASNNIAQRLLITGGCSIGYADQLLPKYRNLSDFSILNTISDDQLTHKVPKFGYFIGFTFNLASTGK